MNSTSLRYSADVRNMPSAAVAVISWWNVCVVTGFM